MNKRILLYILFIFYCKNTFAGNWYSPPDSTKKFNAYYDAAFLYSSNCITNKLAQDYYLGKFITNDRKDDVSGSMENYNRFGLHINSRAAFSVSLDSIFGLSHSWLSFAVSDHYMISSVFKKDVFELYFRGNKNYENKTADLSNFGLNQIRYQQFTIGWGHQFRHNNQHFVVFGGLALNKGNDWLNIGTDKASIFTATGGDYLSLGADMELQRSDSTAKVWKSWKGTGLSADLAFEWTDSTGNRFSVGIADLGFIRWNNNSSYIKADTTFDFTGIDVSDLFDFNSTVTNRINVDSALVQPYLKDRTKKAQTTMLPGRFYVSYIGKLSSDFMLNIAADHFWNANYLPSVTINPGYHKEKYTLWLTNRFGGYGRYFAGLAFQYHHKNWQIGLRSEYLSAMFLPKGKGQGLMLSASHSF